MSLARCSGCSLRPQSKYNDLYCNWSNDLGERVAYRLRLCNGCAAERVLPYVEERSADDNLSCPSCHIDTDTDYAAVFGTIFLQGREQLLLEIPFCGSCRVIWTTWASERGMLLEDRRGAGASPSTHSSGIEVLRAMGIEPRVR
jgi:hypothetical protein